MNLTIINIYLVFFNKKSTILNWIVNIVELHRTFITYAKIMSNFNEEKITQCMCHGLKFLLQHSPSGHKLFLTLSSHQNFSYEHTVPRCFFDQNYFLLNCDQFRFLYLLAYTPIV